MNSRTRLRKWISDHLIETLGVSLLVLSVIAILGGYFYSRYWHEIVKLTFPDFVQEMFSNFGTELLSIAITILVIDWLNRRRQDREKKAELIRDLGSQTNDFAQRAAQELRAQGWHKDGTLRNANLLRANLTDADLWGANLTDADLWGANLTDANLEGADLTNANLRETNLTDANLEGADLTNAFLMKADLTNATLIEADLTNAFLRGADLTNATLWEADLTNATLIEANLTNAFLRGANLTDADLMGADLTNADPRVANLTGARYNNDTKWPEGFDPKTAGAINVDELETEEQTP